MTYGGITLYASGFQQNSVIGVLKNPLLTPQLHMVLPIRIQDVLLPFHSQLLRESLLISFPPHIDMLKFRGLFRTTDGLCVKIYFKVSRRTLFLVLLRYIVPRACQVFVIYNSIC